MASDLLVKLYGDDVPSPAPYIEELKKQGIVIRHPSGSENYNVAKWIRDNFNETWAGEAENACFRSPKSIYIAVKEKEPKDGMIGGEMLGFACYDATAKGFFGPTGVSKDARKQGIGKTLLYACLNAMREEGYGYAIIGWAGPVAYYQKTCNATIIENSLPSVYRGMLWI